MGVEMWIDCLCVIFCTEPDQIRSDQMSLSLTCMEVLNAGQVLKIAPQLNLISKLVSHLGLESIKVKRRQRRRQITLMITLQDIYLRY